MESHIPEVVGIFLNNEIEYGYNLKVIKPITKLL